MPSCKSISVGRPSDVRYTTPSPHRPPPKPILWLKYFQIENHLFTYIHPPVFVLNLPHISDAYITIGLMSWSNKWILVEILGPAEAVNLVDLNEAYGDLSYISINIASFIRGHFIWNLWNEPSANLIKFIWNDHAYKNLFSIWLLNVLYDKLAVITDSVMGLHASTQALCNLWSYHFYDVTCSTE